MDFNIAMCTGFTPSAETVVEYVDYETQKWHRVRKNLWTAIPDDPIIPTVK